MSTAIIAALLAFASPCTPSFAQDNVSAVSAYAVHIDEASQRFGVPKLWIAEVLQAESGGRVRARSTAGAMGLMQLMPRTWEALRERHRLGRDIYDPRDNILAGTAYIAELYAQFGSPGFLAAYNAGPTRYAVHLTTARPLPAETRAYVARLAPRIFSGETTAVPSRGIRSSSDWPVAPLFVAPATHAASSHEPPSGAAAKAAGRLFPGGAQ